MGNRTVLEMFVLGVGIALAFVPMIFPDINRDVAWGGFWLGVLLAVGAGALLAHRFWRSRQEGSGLQRSRWMLVWSIQKSGQKFWPFCRLIPVRRAAKIVYEETRTTLGVKLQERLNKNPEGMIGILAQILVADETVAIYGVYPPSRKFEQIPADDAHSFQFTDDATEMFDSNNESNRYRDLYIKRKDFKRRLGEIRTEYGA